MLEFACTGTACGDGKVRCIRHKERGESERETRGKPRLNGEREEIVYSKKALQLGKGKTKGS